MNESLESGESVGASSSSCEVTQGGHLDPCHCRPLDLTADDFEAAARLAFVDGDLAAAEVLIRMVPASQAERLRADIEEAARG